MAILTVINWVKLFVFLTLFQDFLGKSDTYLEIFSGNLDNKWVKLFVLLTLFQDFLGKSDTYSAVILTVNGISCLSYDLFDVISGFPW